MTETNKFTNENKKPNTSFSQSHDEKPSKSNLQPNIG